MQSPRAEPFPRAAESSDELSEYINLVQQYKDLPLDSDDEEEPQLEAPPEMSSEPESDAGSDGERTRKKREVERAEAEPKAKQFEAQFACNKGG